MKSFERKTLAQIVTDKPAAAPVLEKYELDYSCHGRQSLLEACEFDEKKYGQVKHELEEVLDQSIPGNIVMDFDKLTLNELIDYIISRHHLYVRNAIPNIRLHLQRVEFRQGIRHPLIAEIVRQFDQLTVELENHMFKEEEILFPRIRKVDEIFFKEENIDHLFNVRMISDPIKVMEKEHDITISLMAIIRKLADNFTAPADASAMFSLTYHELKEFEADLHQHVHLENNILFPKAKAMIDRMMAA
jgi:regulator of cell morphogenesis and NO signaling